MPKIEPPKWWETKPAAYGEAGIMLVAGGIFSYLSPIYGIPALIMLFCVSVLLLWKAYKSASILIPVLMIMVCVIFMSVWQEYTTSRRQIPAVSDALTTTTFQNMNIHISDLVKEDNVIRDKTFKNCNLYGPAVMYLDNPIMIRDTFIEPIHLLFIETSNQLIPDSVIVFKDCTFTSCVFHKLSIIGSPTMISELKKKIAFDGNGLRE